MNTQQERYVFLYLLFDGKILVVLATFDAAILLETTTSLLGSEALTALLTVGKAATIRAALEVALVKFLEVRKSHFWGILCSTRILSDVERICRKN